MDCKRTNPLEGVPAVTDPFIQKYFSGRNELIAQEKKQRSGSSRAKMVFADVLRQLHLTLQT